MLVDSAIRRRSQEPVTHAFPDGNSNNIATHTCCSSRQKAQTTTSPSVWRRIQRTLYLFPPTLPAGVSHPACNNPVSQLQVTNKGGIGNNILLKGKNENNKYTEHTEDTSTYNAEAETCELERTIQLMAVPERKSSKKQCLNLVKSISLCSLVDVSWTSVLTLTLCILGLFVINTPVAAEKPFHHRDMSDEPILNPSKSQFSVDNYQAATVSLHSYICSEFNTKIHFYFLRKMFLGQCIGY